MFLEPLDPFDNGSMLGDEVIATVECARAIQSAIALEPAFSQATSGTYEHHVGMQLSVRLSGFGNRVDVSNSMH